MIRGQLFGTGGPWLASTLKAAGLDLTQINSRMADDVHFSHLFDEQPKLAMNWTTGVVEEPCARTQTHPGCVGRYADGRWRIDLVTYPAVWIEFSDDRRTARGRLSESRMATLKLTRPRSGVLRIEEVAPAGHPFVADLPAGWIEVELAQLRATAEPGDVAAAAAEKQAPQ